MLEKSVLALTLWFGGDVNLGARGEEVLAPIALAMKSSIGVVNFEGPIALDSPLPPGEGTGEGDRLINSPTAPKALFSAGVRVAGLANNHALDEGAAGLARTRAALEDAGLLVAPAVLTNSGPPGRAQLP